LSQTCSSKSQSHVRAAQIHSVKIAVGVADPVRVQVWHSVAIAFLLAAVGVLRLGGTVQLSVFVGCLWSALTLSVFAVEEAWRSRRRHP